MAESRICSACGTPVRAGREWCGRCGGDATEPATSLRRFITARRLATAAVPVVMAVVVLALLARPSGEAPTSLAPTTNGRAADSMTRAGAEGAEGAAPLAAFTSGDAARAGTAAYNSGDLQTATSQYTAAVEADPNNAEALNNLGQVLVRSGRAREALPYFDRAIALADAVWAYHFNRARAYAELKEWRQAILGYTEASRLFPDDYVTQFNLAKAFQASGDLGGAVGAYARAIELAPEQADFHLWYAQALDQHGRTQDAIAAYKKFLELDPGASQAEKVKARLAQLGEPAASASS